MRSECLEKWCSKGCDGSLHILSGTDALNSNVLSQLRCPKKTVAHAHSPSQQNCSRDVRLKFVTVFKECFVVCEFVHCLELLYVHLVII